MHKNSLRNNAIVVAAAVAAALIAWAIVRLLGVDPVVGKGNTATVNAADVVAATVAGGAAACAIHTLMVRHGWARWWPFVAGAALSVSLTGPSYLADGGSAAALIGMHVVVAAVLIGGLALLGGGGRRCEPAPPRGRGVPQGY